MVPSQRYCTRCGAANQVQDAFCFACGQPLQATSASPQYPLAGSATSTSTGLLTPNRLLKQRYRILEPLGKGGFGAVYKAEDVQLGNRLLAVKEMSQSGLSPQEIAEATENFKREALLLAGLMHPNLPRIYDHFNEAGRWYLVMDFIEGQTLEAYLQKQPEGHLSVKETLQIGIQLCTVLSYLHTRQPPIIFRDLKPANIMLTREGHLYLIDFGIARHFKPGQKWDTIAFGSPGYAAPEQHGKAQTTARSDIYSLGAVLYQLLSGHDPSTSPFRFPSLQSQVPTIPLELATLITHMLDLDENKRPASMIEVQQKLQRINTRKVVGKKNIAQPSSLAQPVPPVGSSMHQAQTNPPSSPQQTGTPKVAGDLYLKAKRYQEALEAFEQAIQLDSTDAVIYNGKGLALDNLKRHQEALAAFEQAIVLNSNLVNAYVNKGLELYKLKRYQEALSAIERALQLEHANAPAYNLKGVTLEQLGKYEEALAALTRAIQLDPKNSMAFTHKGVALEKLGRYEEALLAHDQAIELDPSNTIAKTNRAKLEEFMKSLPSVVSQGPVIPNPSVHPQQLLGTGKDQFTPASIDQLADYVFAQRSHTAFFPFVLTALIVLNFLLLVVLPNFLPTVALPIILLLTLSASTYGVHIIRQYDRKKIHVALNYRIGAEESKKYQRLCSGLEALAKVHRLQQVTALHAQRNWKQHAGASQLLSFQPVRLLPPHSIAWLETNIPVWGLQRNSLLVLFLPDCILVEKGKNVGAIHYQDLVLSSEYSEFMEAGATPADARIIRYTWHYINKNGTPDLRYRNNYQVAVTEAIYVNLISNRGLKLSLQASNRKNAEYFLDCLRAYRPSPPVQQAPPVQ